MRQPKTYRVYQYLNTRLAEVPDGDYPQIEALLDAQDLLYDADSCPAKDAGKCSKGRAKVRGAKNSIDALKRRS